MIEREIDVTTPEGEMKTFIYHPEHEGPHPVVLYLMDAPSIRPALKDMAMRLASAGYYVMLPYLFYRGGPFREFGKSDEDMHARRELMGTVTPTNIVSDAEALLAVADADPAAARGKIGAVGFCMSGGLVDLARPRHARARGGGGVDPRRVAGPRHARLAAPRARPGEGRGPLRLVRQRPDGAGRARADHEEALEKAGVNYTLDLFTDALHGFAPPGANATTVRLPSCTGSACTPCSAT